jgi:hypothetical protein
MRLQAQAGRGWWGLYVSQQQLLNGAVKCMLVLNLPRLAAHGHLNAPSNVRFQRALPAFIPALQGEQLEFAAYGLMLSAATGREVLAHEMSEALSAMGGASGSNSGAAASSNAPSSSGGGSKANGSAALGGDPGGAGGSGSTSNQWEGRFVEHALAVCRAYVGNDFVRFLRLYEGAPRMAPYLMDLLLGKLRGQAYSEWVAVPGRPACLPAQLLASFLCWGT